MHKISTWAPCKFQRRSHQVLSEVSECLSSCVSVWSQAETSESSLYEINLLSSQSPQFMHLRLNLVATLFHRPQNKSFKCHVLALFYPVESNYWWLEHNKDTISVQYNKTLVYFDLSMTFWRVGWLLRHVDIVAILEVAAQPRELTQVSGVNFIKWPSTKCYTLMSLIYRFTHIRIYSGT